MSWLCYEQVSDEVLMLGVFRPLFDYAKNRFRNFLGGFIFLRSSTERLNYLEDFMKRLFLDYTPPFTPFFSDKKLKRKVIKDENNYMGGEASHTS